MESVNHTDAINTLRVGIKVMKHEAVMNRPSVRVNESCRILYRHLSTKFDDGFLDISELLIQISPPDDLFNYLKPFLRDDANRPSVEGVFVFSDEGEYLGFGGYNANFAQLKYFDISGKQNTLNFVSILDPELNIAIVDIHANELSQLLISIRRHESIILSTSHLESGMIDSYNNYYTKLLSVSPKLRLMFADQIYPEANYMAAFKQSKLKFDPLREVDELDGSEIKGQAVYVVKLNEMRTDYDYLGFGKLDFRTGNISYIQPTGVTESLPTPAFAFYDTWNIVVLA